MRFRSAIPEDLPRCLTMLKADAGFRCSDAVWAALPPSGMAPKSGGMTKK
jgi:hypothetical protein